VSFKDENEYARFVRRIIHLRIVDEIIKNAGKLKGYSDDNSTTLSYKILNETFDTFAKNKPILEDYKK
jgi:hypothetical protein